MRSRPLRVNLILWFTFIFSLVSIISGYATYHVLEKIVRGELDSRLISTATLESAAFKEGDVLDIETINRRPDQYPRFIRQFAQIIDSSGSISSEFGLAEGTSPLITSAELDAVLRGTVLTTDALVDGTPVRLAAVSSDRAGKRYAIVLGSRTDSEQSTMSRMAAIILVMDLAAVVASIAGGYLVVGKALKPLDHISHRARQIGAGELNQRLDQFDSSSEMIHLTEVLNEMFDRLQRMFESQKQFVQDASHELRSPLAALRCRLEIALRQRRSQADYEAVIEESVADTARLSALAEDLFLLAQADSDNLNIQLMEVSLSEICRAVHQQLAALAQRGRVEFTISAEPGCLVYGDEARLHQAMRNIAENALKYTPKGGRVTISVRQEGDSIIAEVEDTGIGIPAEDRANIFRRFYRLDQSRARGDGGTGLGLAICEQIIRAHRGRIEVGSSPSGGARFTVYLASANALLDAASQ